MNKKILNALILNTLKRYFNVPTLVAVLLVVYGFAILTQNTAGIYLI